MEDLPQVKKSRWADRNLPPGSLIWNRLHQGGGFMHDRLCARSGAEMRRLRWQE